MFKSSYFLQGLLVNVGLKAELQSSLLIRSKAPDQLLNGACGEIISSAALGKAEQSHDEDHVILLN